jgi:hypothetical protein
VSPLSWPSNFTLALGAGAIQRGVTLLAGRLSGPAKCRFGPAPGSGRAVSEEDEEDESEELFSRGSPPLPWPMVEGGRGELNCSQNVERSLPNNRQAKLEPKGPRGGGEVVGTHGAPLCGETFTNHPLSLRACSPTTTRVCVAAAAAVLLTKQCFASCALDNAQCRRLQSVPRSPH